jgi:hypothetical protein
MQQQLIQWFRLRRSEAVSNKVVLYWAMHMQKMRALNFAYVRMQGRRDTKLRKSCFRVYKELARHWRMKRYRKQMAALRILARRRACRVYAFRTWQGWTDITRSLRRCAERNLKKRLWRCAALAVTTWCTNTKRQIDIRSRQLDRQLRIRNLNALRQWKFGCSLSHAAKVADHAQFRMQLDLMRSAMTVLAVYTRDRTRRSRLCCRIENLCARRAVRSLHDLLCLLLSLWSSIVQKKRKRLLCVESRWHLLKLSSTRSAILAWVQWMQETRRMSHAHAHQVAIKTLTLNFLLWISWAQREQSRRRIEEALARDRRTATLSSVFLALKYAASIGEDRRTKLQVFCSVRGQAQTLAVDMEIPFARSEVHPVAQDDYPVSQVRTPFASERHFASHEMATPQRSPKHAATLFPASAEGIASFIPWGGR